MLIIQKPPVLRSDEPTRIMHLQMRSDSKLVAACEARAAGELAAARCQRRSPRSGESRCATYAITGIRRLVLDRESFWNSAGSSGRGDALNEVDVILLKLHSIVQALLPLCLQQCHGIRRHDARE